MRLSRCSSTADIRAQQEAEILEIERRTDQKSSKARAKVSNDKRKVASQKMKEATA